jgi:hypothetical protein
MQQYNEALGHLNEALNAMVRQGDTAAIAMIAHPIWIVERAIDRRRDEILSEAIPKAE